MNTKIGIKLKKTSRTNDRRIRFIIKIVLTLISVVAVCPMVFALLTSVKTRTEFYNNVWALPTEFAWENYQYAWEIAKIGEYFFNSVIVVVITVLVTLTVSAFAGYALAKLKVPKADFIMMCIFLLTMLPSESIIMPVYLMISKLGFTGTFPSLILPYIGWGSALTIYIYRNFFATVPTEIIEAARIDGCSEFRTFISVVFPLMLPATATNAIFLFLSWWGEMLWASIELSTSSIKTVALGITAFVQSAGTNWGPLCAASCIVLIPVILFFLFAQKYMIAGLTGGAVKG